MVFSLPYPLSLNRYWTVLPGTRQIGPSIEGRRWKQAARALALTRKPAGAPIDGAVAVGIELHPKARRDGKASGTRVDVDNACKLALDALQGVAYANDRQIEVLVVRVARPLPDGGMTVTVEPV